MDERRRHTRHRVYYPVQIDTAEKKERVAVARNTSVSGVLVGSPSRYAEGEAVELMFRVDQKKSEHKRVRGTIVRAGQDQTGGWFSRTYAVKFEEELPWLEDELARAEPEQGYLRR